MIRIWLLISKLYFKLLTLLNFTALILIFFMAFWMFGDVVARYAFNRPFPGTTELVKSLLTAIVFLSLGYTLWHGRHVRVEIIFARLPYKLRGILNVVANVMGFLAFFLMAFYSWGPAWQGWLVREYEGVQLKVPIYPIRFISVIGAAIFSLQFLINTISALVILFKSLKESDS